MFTKLYINKNVLNSRIAKKIFIKSKVPFKLVENESIFLKKLRKKENIFNLGKKILYLTEKNESFIKKCPGTKNYFCCGYLVIHYASFCFMDCSYCILQNYFYTPIMQLFTNFNKLEQELNLLFSKKYISRIGTGEFTDSLILENLTGFSSFLIKKFSKQKKSILELKTKTHNIINFKNLVHNKKTILSWSLNTPRVIKMEEKLTSSLNLRLVAASKCESWGYPLAFHFDPMFIYRGCKKEYNEVIKLLFKTISYKNIVWISLGTFRFIPVLELTVKKRFSSSKILYSEFIRGLDGKMRYFKSLRFELYNYMVRCIRDIAPDLCIYLCMEDYDIWKEVMGINLKNNRMLSDILDMAVLNKCNLDIN